MIHKSKNLIKENTKHSKFSIKLFSHKDIEQQILINNQIETTLDLANYQRNNEYVYQHPLIENKTIAVTKKIQNIYPNFNDLNHDNTSDFGFEATTRGNIIHSVLEHMDFNLDLDDNLKILKDIELYNQDEWNIINKYYPHFKAFFESDVCKLMNSAKQLYKEKNFSMMDEGQIIHGIFDAICINDNNVTIIDYKTDTLKKSTSNETLINLHKAQMDYYKKILARVFPQTNIQAIVYYLNIDKYITIK